MQQQIPEFSCFATRYDNPLTVSVNEIWYLEFLEKNIPDMEASCEYIQYAVADSQQGKILSLSGGGQEANSS